MLSSWHKNQTNNLSTIGQAKNWLTENWPLGQAQPIFIAWLLSFITNYPVSHIIAYPETKLTTRQRHKLQQSLTKLVAGYPLAYITGQQDFYGRVFQTTPAVLIPRPESECLVDIVKKLRQSFNQPAAWLDIGTGSGCLIISTALELMNKDFFAGSDISRSALRLAKKNSAKLQAPIDWRHGSLLRSWLKDDFGLARQIFILANLPYLTPDKYHQKQQELHHEPKLALLGGTDGLDLFKKLALELPLFIKNHPQKIIHVLTESSLGQVTTLQNILAVGGLKWQKSFPDLTGRARFNWWHN
ncbi:peptide chain release factor N(5)-glutamine methyltransferase [Candidatus Falkowbacteria bacterium]|nr:peptide chain release factor N(5)-glutamine methyltransferase [Candidatus Falkowbacteria bacterium]